MCNLSQHVLDEGMAKGIAKGMEKGMAQGMAQGMVEGETKGRILALASLVADGTISLSTAASKMGMAEEEFEAKAKEYQAHETAE